MYMNIYMAGYTQIYICMAGFLGLAPESRHGRFIRDTTRFLVYTYLYVHIYIHICIYNNNENVYTFYV